MALLLVPVAAHCRPLCRGLTPTPKMASIDYPVRLRMFLLARETALYQNDLTSANRRLSEAQDYIEQRRGPQCPAVKISSRWAKRCWLLGVEPQVVLENCFRQAEKMDSTAARGVFLPSGQLALNKPRLFPRR